MPSVHWEVVSNTRETSGGILVVTKKPIGHVDNSGRPAIKVDIQLMLSTPANAKGPVPVNATSVVQRDANPWEADCKARRFNAQPGPRRNAKSKRAKDRSVFHYEFYAGGLGGLLQGRIQHDSRVSTHINTAHQALSFFRACREDDF